MMTRLERRGLIARRRSEEDRRKVVVAITDLGRSAFGEVRALVGEQFLTPDVNANLFFHDFKTAVPITRSRFLGYLGVILQQFGDWSRAPYPP